MPSPVSMKQPPAPSKDAGVPFPAMRRTMLRTDLGFGVSVIPRASMQVPQTPTLLPRRVTAAR